MKALYRRTLAGLIPADAAAEEGLRKVKMGALVTVEIKRPRNAKMLRLYWALVGLVWENVDNEVYPTTESLHRAFKRCLGVVEEYRMPNGKVFEDTGSIAFDRMSQQDFDAFFNRVCDMVSKHFLPGVTDAELRREVSQMTGIAA